MKTITPIGTSTTTASASSGSRNRRIIIPISTVIGAALILTLIVAGYVILRRRRHASILAFEAARLRDPTLTWEEHARRRRFTRSRLLFEEEILRSTIIRKSLQGRTSLANGKIQGIGGDIRNTNNIGEGSEGVGPEVIVQLQRSDGNWSYDGRYSDSQQRLLSGKSISSPTEYSQNVEEARGNAAVPPARPRTPPILAHPVFRDWTRPFPTRSSSLPLEMTRTRPIPLR